MDGTNALLDEDTEEAAEEDADDGDGAAVEMDECEGEDELDVGKGGREEEPDDEEEDEADEGNAGTDEPDEDGLEAGEGSSEEEEEDVSAAVEEAAETVVGLMEDEGLAGRAEVKDVAAAMDDAIHADEDAADTLPVDDDEGTSPLTALLAECRWTASTATVTPSASTVTARQATRAMSGRPRLLKVSWDGVSGSGWGRSLSSSLLRST